METPRKEAVFDPVLAGRELRAPLDWAPLFDVLPQGVLLADASGLCVQANPSAARILGTRQAELPAKSLEALLGWTQPQGGPGPAPVTLARPRPDGTLQYLEVSTVSGQAGGTVVVFIDITEARTHKARLERMTQLYAALSQVNQAIVWSSTQESLLAKICEVMVEFGKFTMAWIGWDDPVTHEIAVLSRYGDTAGYLDGLRIRSDDTPLGRGATGRAIRTGQPCVINDFMGSTDSRPWHGPATRAGFEASAAFPIRMDGRVAGALTVYAGETDFFGTHEIALLEEAAGDISFALDHLALDARRREAEDALRESRSRLQRAESVAAFGNWEWDLATGHMRASRGAHLIYGLDREDMTLAEVQGRALPEFRPTLDSALKDLILGGRPYNVEFRIRRGGDEEVRTIHSVAEFDPVKRTVFGVIHDITERKRVEDALRQSEFFFKESQRAAAIGSYQADFRTGFWESSAVLDAIFGIDEHYVRSIQGWVDLIHPEDRAMMERHLQYDVIAGHQPFSRQYRIVRPSDGQTRWVHGLGEGSFDDQGAFVSLIGTIRDVTDQTLAEQENARLHAGLQQAQKMESLGLLAGGVAHDMNNVLAAILALASVHELTQPEGSPVHHAFATIAEAAERGGKLVKGLLTFARQNPVEVRELDLNKVLTEEARLLEHTTLAKVALVLDLGPGLRPIQGDENALVHAFMNLCVNAVDAMPERGTLTLRTRNLQDGWVEAVVEDTGTGMTREVLAKALDPFFTTKETGKGTGLGLSMVYATVKAHKGRMDLDSAPGKGTRVRLRFPPSEAGSPWDKPSGPRALAKLGKLRLLFVDDDELILQSSRLLIGALGLTAVFASSGEEALAELEGGFRPDLVILDLNMPGLGGTGTLPRLRALCPEVPVLLATGRVDDSALALIQAHDHVTLLAKPFGVAELQRHLEAAEAGSVH